MINQPDKYFLTNMSNNFCQVNKDVNSLYCLRVIHRNGIAVLLFLVFKVKEQTPGQSKICKESKKYLNL